MENNILNKLHINFKTIIIFFISLFIIIIGLFIYHIFTNIDTSYINITNLDSINNLPNETKEEIKHYSYDMAKYNYNDIEQVGMINAKIRDNSIVDEYDKESQIHYSSFILDLEQIKQSYHIYYSWFENTNTNTTNYIDITCLTLDDLIYGNFKCKNLQSLDDNNNNYDTISYKLPYTNKIQNYTYKVNSVEYYYNSYEPFLRILFDTCVNEDIKNQALNNFKSYIKDTLGLDPDSFNLKVTDTCE